MEREALKLALEALESGVKTTSNRISWTEYDTCLMNDAITAIHEALAQPAQRPWVKLTEEDFSAINQSCLTKLQAATSAESILMERNS